MSDERAKKLEKIKEFIRKFNEEQDSETEDIYEQLYEKEFEEKNDMDSLDFVISQGNSSLDETELAREEKFNLNSDDSFNLNEEDNTGKDESSYQVQDFEENKLSLDDDTFSLDNINDDISLDGDEEREDFVSGSAYENSLQDSEYGDLEQNFSLDNLNTDDVLQDFGCADCENCSLNQEKKEQEPIHYEENIDKEEQDSSKEKEILDENLEISPEPDFSDIEMEEEPNYVLDDFFEDAQYEDLVTNLDMNDNVDEFLQSLKLENADDSIDKKDISYNKVEDIKENDINLNSEKFAENFINEETSDEKIEPIAIEENSDEKNGEEINNQSDNEFDINSGKLCLDNDNLEEDNFDNIEKSQNEDRFDGYSLEEKEDNIINKNVEASRMENNNVSNVDVAINSLVQEDLNKMNYVDKAESVIDELIKDFDLNSNPDRKLISSIQIDNLYDRVNSLYAKLLASRDNNLLSSDMIAKISDLRLAFVLEAGKDRSVKTFLKSSGALDYLKNIGDDPEKLIVFNKYMKALVAFRNFKL